MRVAVTLGRMRPFLRSMAAEGYLLKVLPGGLGGATESTTNTQSYQEDHTGVEDTVTHPDGNRTGESAGLHGGTQDTCWTRWG